MAIRKKIEDELSKQVNAELYSAYLYLSMSTYFGSENLSGFASWMKKQALEEAQHADKIMDFIQERGGRVRLAAIEGPKTEWKGPLDAFSDAYMHEQKVTGMINKLVSLSRSEEDYATEQFLSWFVKEQVEEEASADSIVQKLKLIGENKGGLFMLDRELFMRK